MKQSTLFSNLAIGFTASGTLLGPIIGAGAIGLGIDVLIFKNGYVGLFIGLIVGLLIGLYSLYKRLLAITKK